MMAEEESMIPIVMASDNGYAYPMIVAIQSALLSANPNTAYRFYLLVSDDFSEENRKYIRNLFDNNLKSSCCFIDMHEAYDDANIQIAHITKATYYRLQLPSLLPDESKCIYLDVDTVVKKDLSAFFRTCIDDKYIAGVRALAYLRVPESVEKHKALLEIDSLDEYVNAGVLLMNLAKMRRDNLEKIFEKLLVKEFPSQDQDIINSACYGKIRIMPFGYNAMTKYPLDSDTAYSERPYFQQYMSKKEWNNGRTDPTIIHYADKKKPWNDFSSLYADEWWKVVYTLPPELSGKIASVYIETAVKNAGETEKQRKLAVAQKKALRTRCEKLKGKNRKLEHQYTKLNKRLRKITQSRAYKMMRVLLSPLTAIKNVLKNKA